MTKERANLGFGNELKQFDPNAWKPRKDSIANDKATRDAPRKAAEATGFQSREPEGQGDATPRKQQRRRRTGRNAQFNIKAKPETIEAFCTVADAQGWGLGEALEYAVILMEREYLTKN